MNLVPPPTIFIDLDGTIFKHYGNDFDKVPEQEILDGVKEKFDEWKRKDYIVIIVTARPYSAKKFTIDQLEKFELAYSQLIMNVGSGVRYLINDTKPYASLDETAIGISVKRDGGIKKVKIT